jgi:endonuclease YncB( thermonuclease family)
MALLAMEKIMRSSLIFFTILTSSTVFGNGTTATGKVISVIDGNTVEVLTEANEVVLVILADIDSPELAQEFGNEAKEYLEKISLKKEVIIEFRGKDRKGNNIGILLIKGKTDARVALLQEGLAWTSERNPNPELETHRTSAQAEGKGLWRNDNPTPPWIYRREQTMLQPKSS